MSIEQFNENLNAVAGSNDPAVTALVLSLLESDLNVIQKLDDEPNDVGGLTAAELKAKFDEAGNLIKGYINGTLLPALSDTVAEAEVRAAAEAKRVEDERTRLTAETGRVNAETARAAAEQERLSAEQVRVSNEKTRVSAEKKRISAEQARAAAETAREDRETGYVAQAQYWAEQAKEIAGGDFAPKTHAAQHGKNGSDPVTPAAIGAVPAARKVNGHALDADIALTAADVAAAPAADHRIKAYTVLSQIGLTDTDDMSAEDVRANFVKIFNALGGIGTIAFTSGYTTNFAKSVFAKLTADVGDTMECWLDVQCLRTSDVNLQIDVVPQFYSASNPRPTNRYSCVLRYIPNGTSYLSPFVLTRSKDGFFSRAGGTIPGAVLGMLNGLVKLGAYTNMLQISSYHTVGDSTLSSHLQLLSGNNADQLNLVTYDKDGKRADYPLIHLGNKDRHGVGQTIVGSYVGTGTYGETNPNSLTFNRPPKFLAICEANGVAIFNNTSGNLMKYMGITDALTTEYQTNVWMQVQGSGGWGPTGHAKCSEDRKTISWYVDDVDTESTGTSAQCNIAGTVYRYVAFC